MPNDNHVWDRLSALNDALVEADDLATQSFVRPSSPIVLIVGPPRSGSTLFVQTVMSRYRIGYVSNVLARFWKAPYLGALLEREILSDADRYVSDFTSSYGNTSGPYEPHEWSWFWKSHLGLEGDAHYCLAGRPPALAQLTSKLAALERVKQAPLLFDNVYAMTNLSHLRRALGRILIVHLDRDPYFVCNSILDARLRRYGDRGAWFGHRPACIADIQKISDPVEQVVHQVDAVRRENERALAACPVEDIFNVRYEDFVARPADTVSAFRGFLEENGFTISVKPTDPDFAFSSRNLPELINPEFGERLKDLCRTHFPPLSAERAA